MKAILLDIAQYLTVAAVVALFLYLQFKRFEAQTKDLGDGGIQTLFGRKGSKLLSTELLLARIADQRPLRRTDQAMRVRRMSKGAF